MQDPKQVHRRKMAQTRKRTKTQKVLLEPAPEPQTDGKVHSSMLWSRMLLEMAARACPEQPNAPKVLLELAPEPPNARSSPLGIWRSRIPNIPNIPNTEVDGNLRRLCAIVASFCFKANHTNSNFSEEHSSMSTMLKKPF